MKQRSEDETRAFLKQQLAAGFDLFEEVPVRHALFRRRRLRVDMLAIPKDPGFSDIALAIETKPDREWNIPTWGEALKQAHDYVFATVEPDLPLHEGKRVMAAFVYPSPLEFVVEGHHFIEDSRQSFHAGMLHMATYHRVGIAKMERRNGAVAISLRLPEVLWTAAGGWRGTARNVLAGKRQLASQRFSILEELAACEPLTSNKNV